MNKNIIEAIIVTTTCPNFRDGGILIIEKGLTRLPLDKVLTRIENGIENNESIRIPHKDDDGYTRLFPQFIVSYDVYMK